jgi:hypothetical protein
MRNVLRKLGSVKVWIALWSIWLITHIVVKDLSAFNNLAMLAMGPVVGYLAANVWEDKIHLDGGRPKADNGAEK